MTGHRSIDWGFFDALTALPLFVTAPIVRHWHMRWGATDAEVREPMPGEDAVPTAHFNATRAITINAPPTLVWPWIVQMGYRRAGFYTYALLDNAGYESASEILDEYQRPRVGDWMPMASVVNETTAFKVKDFETDTWLLWGKPDSTWAWKLVALPNGGTRLITRLKQRYQWESPGMALFTLLLLEFGDFPMMRRVLRGIKERAERLARNTKHVARGRITKLAGRREIMMQGLDSLGIPYGRPGGGFYIWADISRFGLPAADLCRRLLIEGKVLIFPGSSFGERWSGYARISLLQPEDRLKEAVRRMSGWFQSLSA